MIIRTIENVGGHAVGRRREAGFTLLEVLVAVFVLAIGVLGMARLILIAKQVNYEAVQRSLAITLAQDMMERVRSNPRSLGSYDGASVGSGSATAQSCTGTCSATQLAAYDIYQWDQALYGSSEAAGGRALGGLVMPAGCITANANVVTVEIAWMGSRDSVIAGASTCGAAIGSRRQIVSVQSYVANL